MTQLTTLRKNRNGNSGLFPSLRNNFFTDRFFTPRLFDLDDDFITGDISSPPANITETNKEFLLDLSVPGMKREDFELEVENGVLTISSEKEEEKKEEDKNYHRREFSYTSFSRTFTLPDNVDENNISAKYDNGMLKITLPKSETTVSKPKKEIKVS
jgi:HSP20 family protein